MKKRRFALWSFALGLLSLAACSHATEPVPDAAACNTRSAAEIQNDAYRILFGYLRMDDDKTIHLEVTEQEAGKLGVPADCYRKALEDIRSANEFIQRMREAGEEVDQLRLPDLSDANDTPAMLSRGNEVQFPAGHYSVNGNGPTDIATACFFAPLDMSAVQFQCRGHAALACVHSCTTYSLGTTNSGGRVGSPWSNTLITVPLAASNVDANASYSCSDPNGGTASWRGI